MARFDFTLVSKLKYDKELLLKTTIETAPGPLPQDRIKRSKKGGWAIYIK